MVCWTKKLICWEKPLSSSWSTSFHFLSVFWLEGRGRQWKETQVPLCPLHSREENRGRGRTRDRGWVKGTGVSHVPYLPVRFSHSPNLRISNTRQKRVGDRRDRERWQRPHSFSFYCRLFYCYKWMPTTAGEWERKRTREGWLVKEVNDKEEVKGQRDG